MLRAQIVGALTSNVILGLRLRVTIFWLVVITSATIFVVVPAAAALVRMTAAASSVATSTTATVTARGIVVRFSPSRGRRCRGTGGASRHRSCARRYRRRWHGSVSVVIAFAESPRPPPKSSKPVVSPIIRPVAVLVLAVATSDSKAVRCVSAAWRTRLWISIPVVPWRRWLLHLIVIPAASGRRTFVIVVVPSSWWRPIVLPPLPLGLIAGGCRRYGCSKGCSNVWLFRSAIIVYK